MTDDLDKMVVPKTKAASSNEKQPSRLGLLDTLTAFLMRVKTVAASVS